VADPFTLFGLAPSFDLDIDQIEGRWREVSKAVHPDKHAAGSSADRRQALSKAMDLNAAFRILKDPIRRAEAVLATVVPTTGTEGKEPAAPMELLMQMMQLRGDLANARTARDAEAIAASIEEVRALQTASLATTSRLLAALTGEPSSDPLAAQQEIGKLRYYRRFLEEAEAILDDLADSAAANPPATRDS
jgi:molecular chaperone HscB